MSKQPSRRAQRQERAQKKRLKSNLVRGGIITLALVAIVYIGWLILRPLVGEAVPVLASGHVAEGQPLNTPESDPPTSGDHYDSPLPAKFYLETDLVGLPPNPDGYLIHNLEHGYIIFWYNCALVEDCDALKSQIQSVMDETNGFKLVAFPRDTLEAPVVMTSWGRKQVFNVFDPDAARTFVKRNLNRSPEPTAP